MPPMTNKHLEQFEQALAGWTDERFISRDELRALAMFNLYLVNLAEQDGWEYYGHSYKAGTPMGCLVVKATIDGVPQVVFSSGRTPTNCVRIFIRNLGDGLLNWQRDKYRE